MLLVAVLSGYGGGSGSTAAVPIPPASGTITTLTASANGGYKELTYIDFTATFTEAVTVSGTPRIILNVGGTAKYANNLSVSGTTVLVFQLIIFSFSTVALIPLEFRRVGCCDDLIHFGYH